MNCDEPRNLHGAPRHAAVFARCASYQPSIIKYQLSDSSFSFLGNSAKLAALPLPEYTGQLLITQFAGSSSFKAGLEAPTGIDIRLRRLRLRRDRANAARGLRGRANTEWGRRRMSVTKAYKSPNCLFTPNLKTPYTKSLADRYCVKARQGHNVTELLTTTSLTGNSWQNLKHYYIYGIPEALAAALHQQSPCQFLPIHSLSLYVSVPSMYTLASSAV